MYWLLGEFTVIKAVNNLLKLESCLHIENKLINHIPKDIQLYAATKHLMFFIHCYLAHLRQQLKWHLQWGVLRLSSEETEGGFSFSCI